MKTREELAEALYPDSIPLPNGELVTEFMNGVQREKRDAYKAGFDKAIELAVEILNQQYGTAEILAAARRIRALGSGS